MTNEVKNSRIAILDNSKDEATTTIIHQLEASRYFDIVENLKAAGKISDETFVISNGFKRAQYVTNIARLINNGHKNAIPIIDNYEEIELLSEEIDRKFSVGIRIASEEGL